MHNLTNQDTYQIYCKGYLSEDRIRVLTHLYQPLCRYEALSLYMTMYHEIERGRMLNTQATHYRLLNITQMSTQQFKDALYALEGLGLIRTFHKDTHYIYELMLPLNPKRFFEHEVLNTLLYHTLGEVDYERTKYYFKIPSIDLSDYTNATHHFDEVFHIDLSEPFILTKNTQSFNEDLHHEPEVSYDLNLFYQGLEDYRISRQAISKEVESAIVSLGVVYHISPITMRKLVYDVYENGEINIEDLQERCLRYYEFENQTNLTKVLESSNKQEQKEATNKRDKKIQQLKTLSPYQYLQALQKGAAPTSRDLSLIEKLMTEQKLNQGVVNVLVETVIVLNNGQLPKNHLEYLAGMFARKNIKTVEQAMDEAKAYMNARNQPKSNKIEKVQNVSVKKDKPQMESNVSQEEYKDLMNEIQKLLKGDN